MDPLTALLGGVAIVVMLLSGAAVASSTAVFALSTSRVRTLVEEGFTGASALSRLRASEGLKAALDLLATTLGLVTVGLGVAASVASWGPIGGLAGLPVVIAVLLVGHLVPHGLAARHPVRVALAAAPLLLPVERVIRVVFDPWVRVRDWVAGRNGEEPDEPDERVVQEMTELGREEGVVDVDEHLLVERAFRLDDLAAWEVMTPRVEIFAWSADLTLRDIVDHLPTVPYSRVPVYRSSIDDVTGILYVREAYATYISGQQDLPLQRVAREPLFVPASLSLSHLLRAFQNRRIHMGIVADEFGGTDGLVTLEDVLEELVGEIVDETDVAEEPIIRLAGDLLLADADVDLREINDLFKTALPQLEHRSLNGFILEELGRVPAVGESFERHGLQVQIVEATDTHVLRARLRKLSPAGQPEGEGGAVERNT